MRVENQPTSRNDSLAVVWVGCQMESAPTSRYRLIGVRGGRGAGASWKTHQRVVKRLVGGREVVGVWVPVEKDTNESQ